MLCKWCGMESATTDQCSWCHRALTSTADGSQTAKTAGETAPKNRPPVTVRRASAPLSGPDTHSEMEESPLINGSDTAPIARASKIPAPPMPPSPAPMAASAADHAEHQIIGLRRAGSKGGARMPAPSMPPIRSSNKPTPPVSLQKHVPAPAILPVSLQNRAGGAIPKSPHVPAPIMAPIQAKSNVSSASSIAASTPVALNAGAPARATALAEAMPDTESGGLADGVSASRPPSVQAAAEMHVPAMGTFTPAQSKYYPGQVVDPTSGTHYDVDSGKPTDTPAKKTDGKIELHWDDPAASYRTLLFRYLAAFAGVLVIAGLIAHAYKTYYVLPLLAALFFGGLLLPIMQVAPKQRDDSDDLWIFAALIMIFGPAIGLVIYGIIGLMRQSVNHAIMGCFLVSVLTELVIYFAGGSTRLLFGPPWVQGQVLELKVLFINWSAFASLIGWICANMFHKFDE